MLHWYEVEFSAPQRELSARVFVFVQPGTLIPIAGIGMPLLANLFSVLGVCLLGYTLAAGCRHMHTSTLTGRSCLML